MITTEQFNFQMDRLRESWPKAFDSANRVEMIWDICKVLEFGDFVETVNTMISSMRRHPVPIDFSEAVKSKRRYVNNPTAIENRILCGYCGDLGIVRVVFVAGQRETLALCECPKGADQYWKLPVATANLKREATIEKLPIDWFKPSMEGWRQETVDQQAVSFGTRVRDAIKFWDENGVVE